MSDARHARAILCCEVNDAIGRLLRRLGPSENVAEHFRQSRIEFLKGIRAVLDERIEHTSRSQRKGTRVNVE